MKRSIYAIPAALIFSMIAATLLSAQEGDWDYPAPLGPTNVGTDFWFSVPTSYDEPNVSIHYVRLYIVSAFQTQVTVNAAGAVKQETTKPYEVVWIDLTKNEAQAFNRANSGPIPDDQIYTNKGVHITAEQPIAVYAVNRTNFTADGMTLLPTNALGNRYVVASATDGATNRQPYQAPTQYLITAPYDETVVTIEHTNITPNHEKGEPFTITMKKGDVFSAMSTGPNGDLSGSMISATKPVALTTGQNCAFLPTPDNTPCDYMCGMLPPLGSWGTTYHAVPLAERKKADLFRVFAAEENTTVMVNGEELAVLNGPVGGADEAWVEYLPEQRTPLEFTADKPIFVSQYANCRDYDNTSIDPFQMVLMPVEGYGTQALFSTPKDDFGFNYVSLICAEDAYDDLEIAEGAEGDWEKVAEKYGDEENTFPTEVGGVSYVGKTFSIPPGTYRMRAPGNFGGYLQGFSNETPYGFPLAVSTPNLDRGDQDPPEIAVQTEIPESGFYLLNVSDAPEAEATRSNLSTVMIDPRQSENYAFYVSAPVKPGLDRSVLCTLEVKNSAQDARALLVAVDMAGNVTTQVYEYTAPTGGTPIAEVTGHNFGDVRITTVGKGMITIKNLSTDGGVLEITSMTPPGSDVFAITGGVPSLPLEVQPGGTEEFEVTFAPTAEQDYMDSIVLVHNASGSDNRSVIPLSGSGFNEVGGFDEVLPGVLSCSIAPNPSTGSERIALHLTLERRSTVTVTIVDPSGATVGRPFSRRSMEGGEHLYALPVENLSSGLYLCRIEVEGRVMVRPLVVAR